LPFDDGLVSEEEEWYFRPVFHLGFRFDDHDVSAALQREFELDAYDSHHERQDGAIVRLKGDESRWRATPGISFRDRLGLFELLAERGRDRVGLADFELVAPGEGRDDPGDEDERKKNKYLLHGKPPFMAPCFDPRLITGKAEQEFTAEDLNMRVNDHFPPLIHDLRLEAEATV